jgi:PEP-CTERM motif
MNAIQKQMLSALAFLVACVLIVSTVVADPLPGRDLLKFSQKPMNGTIIPTAGTVQQYWGHDELSTAYSAVTDGNRTPYRGTFMADDFADKLTSPVVHVKWWGSYLNNFQNPNIPLNKFLISFESDAPVTDTNPFSHPSQPLLNQIVRRGPLAPGSGTFTETPISLGGPPLGEALYEYNAELHLDKSFFEKADTVYWLKIVALVDLPPGVAPPDPNQPPTFAPRWGWHNRDYTIKDTLASTAPLVNPGETQVGTIGLPPGGVPIYHFQDDAVTGNVFVNTQLTPMGEIMPFVEQGGYQPRRYLGLADGPPIIAEFSKDLAFELYTVPEPATCVLIAIGLAGVVGLHRRRPTR